MNTYQIDSDSRMVWDYYGCRPGDAGVPVPDEKIREWHDIQEAWEGMQRELRALHDANPGTELGDKLPEDDEEG